MWRQNYVLYCSQSFHCHYIKIALRKYVIIKFNGLRGCLLECLLIFGVSNRKAINYLETHKKVARLKAMKYW